jgi:hypothetical protein
LILGYLKKTAHFWVAYVAILKTLQCSENMASHCNNVKYGVRQNNISSE